MKKNIKKLFYWIKTNREALVYIIGTYLVLTYLLNLPYINLIKIYLSAFPLLIAWVFAIIVFRPKKEKILKIGLGLFIINFLFAVVHLQGISESLADVSYFMIFTYIVMALYEIKSK